jgi:hypothetical protein
MRTVEFPYSCVFAYIRGSNAVAVIMSIMLIMLILSKSL